MRRLNPCSIFSRLLAVLAACVALCSTCRLVMAGGQVGGEIRIAPGELAAADDDLRPIEDIRPGDLVWSFDEATGFATLSPVVRTFESTADELVELTLGGETIRVTPEHPFWVDGLGWTAANSLVAGNRLLTRSGAAQVVGDCAWHVGRSRVFNLEVARTHTYVVGPDGALVHNVCLWQLTKTTVRVLTELTIGKHSKSGGVSIKHVPTNQRLDFGRLPGVGKHAQHLADWMKGRFLPHYHRRGPGGIAVIDRGSVDLATDSGIVSEEGRRLSCASWV